MTSEEQAAKDAAEKAAKANEEQAAANAKAARAADEKAAQTAKDAVVADAKKPVVIVGRPGGAFNIDGVGFGGSGQLTIGGRVIVTTSWRDTRIKGQIPEGISGAVVLTTDSGVRHGVFPVAAS